MDGAWIHLGGCQKKGQDGLRWDVPAPGVRGDGAHGLVWQLRPPLGGQDKSQVTPIPCSLHVLGLDSPRHRRFGVVVYSVGPRVRALQRKGMRGASSACCLHPPPRSGTTQPPGVPACWVLCKCLCAHLSAAAGSAGSISAGSAWGRGERTPRCKCCLTSRSPSPGGHGARWWDRDPRLGQAG